MFKLTFDRYKVERNGKKKKEWRIRNRKYSIYSEREDFSIG